MLMKRIAVVNTVVVFTRPGYDYATRDDRIDAVFNDERDVAAYIYIYFALVVDMGVISIKG